MGKKKMVIDRFYACNNPDCRITMSRRDCYYIERHMGLTTLMGHYCSIECYQNYAAPYEKDWQEELVAK